MNDTPTLSSSRHLWLVHGFQVCSIRKRGPYLVVHDRRLLALPVCDHYRELPLSSYRKRPHVDALCTGDWPCF